MVKKSHTKKLVDRAKFARMARVTQSSVTKLCKRLPKEALKGKRIDSNHPLCIKYIEDKAAALQIEPVTGVDERYEEALKYCVETGNCSIRYIQNYLSIPKRRAEKISKLIKATGLVSSKKPNIKTKLVKQKPVTGYTAQNEKKRKKSLETIKNQDNQNTDFEKFKLPDDIEEYGNMTLKEIFFKFGTETAFMDHLKAMKSIEDINGKRIANAKEKGKLVSREIVKRGIIEPIDAIHIQLLTDGSKKLAIEIFSMFNSGETSKEAEKHIKKEITSFLSPLKDKIGIIMDRLVKNA